MEAKRDAREARERERERSEREERERERERERTDSVCMCVFVKNRETACAVHLLISFAFRLDDNQLEIEDIQAISNSLVVNTGLTSLR